MVGFIYMHSYAFGFIGARNLWSLIHNSKVEIFVGNTNLSCKRGVEQDKHIVQE